MLPQTEHSWFVARLFERHIGVLEDSDEGRLQEHLVQCGKCHELWQSFVMFDTAGREDDVHIPDSILSDWATRRKTLRGKLRDLVDQHLGHCPECREHVDAHASEASFDAGLNTMSERSAAVATTPLADASASRPSTRTDEPPLSAPGSSRHTNRGWFTLPSWSPKRLKSWNWAVAAWAVTATGILLVHPRSAPIAPDPAADGVLPWVAPALTRGRGNVVHVPSSAHAIVLRVELPAEWPSGTAATIEVYAPAGALLLRAPATVADVMRGEIMLIVRTPVALSEGTYHVRILRLDTPGTADEKVFDLEYGAP